MTSPFWVSCSEWAVGEELKLVGVKLFMWINMSSTNKQGKKKQISSIHESIINSIYLISYYNKWKGAYLN